MSKQEHKEVDNKQLRQIISNVNQVFCLGSPNKSTLDFRERIVARAAYLHLRDSGESSPNKGRVKYSCVDFNSLVIHPAQFLKFHKQISLTSLKKSVSNEDILKELLPKVGLTMAVWHKHTEKNQFFVTNKEAIKIGGETMLKGLPAPEDAKKRILLLTYLLADARVDAFSCGSGNCQLMADLAFLLVIQRVEGQQIHYIQFRDSQDKVEELNTVVVGPWPEAEKCWVLAPWLNEKQALIRWMGRGKTPLLKGYDTELNLFDVTTEDERLSFVDVLKKERFDFHALMQGNTRKNSLAYINKITRKALGMSPLKEEKTKKDSSPKLFATSTSGADVNTISVSSGASSAPPG